jgi:hypothetical protein
MNMNVKKLFEGVVREAMGHVEYDLWNYHNKLEDAERRWENFQQRELKPAASELAEILGIDESEAFDLLDDKLRDGRGFCLDEYCCDHDLELSDADFKYGQGLIDDLARMADDY